jgi:hypothetical protein
MQTYSLIPGAKAKRRLQEAAFGRKQEENR